MPCLPKNGGFLANELQSLLTLSERSNPDFLKCYLTLARALMVYMLNWLCIVEKRAEGGLLVVEGLWIARTRQPSVAGILP